MDSISFNDIDLSITEPVSKLYCSSIFIIDDYFENPTYINDDLEDSDIVHININKVPSVSTATTLEKNVNSLLNIFEAEINPYLSTAIDIGIVSGGVIYYSGITGTEIIINKCNSVYNQNISLSGSENPFYNWVVEGFDNVKYTFNNINKKSNQIIEEIWI